MFRNSLTLAATFNTTWHMLLLVLPRVIKCLQLLLIICTVHFLLLIQNLAQIVCQLIALIATAINFIYGLNCRLGS